MLSYWDILILLTGIELIIAVLVIIMIYNIKFSPTGIRLLSISALFALQSILGLVIYNKWKSAGYGPDISEPLIVLQTTILAGLIILLDIVRK